MQVLSLLKRAAKLIGKPIAVLLGLGVLGGAGMLVTRIFPIATGISAKTVCSDVFVAGRDEHDLLRDEVPKAWFVSYSVDRAAQTASASVLGLARKTAVFRPGLGCTLAIGVTPDELRADPAATLAPTTAPDRSQPWPWGDGDDARSLPPGVDPAALEAAIAPFFDQTPREPGGTPLNTRAVVIAHQGQLVYERYAQGFSAETPQLGWSMTKSVTSALVGHLAANGVVAPDAPMPFAQWHERADDPRAALTWDHLLRMSSGLRFNEDYGLRTDVTVMLFDVQDGSRVALDQPLQSPPDTTWQYASGTTNLLTRGMREVIHDDSAYLELPRVALFERIGMRSAVLEPDPSGTLVGSSFMYATPRDWARFGQLFLQRGQWTDHDGATSQVLPASWVDGTTAPTPTHPSGGYGGQWWTNAGEDPASRTLPGVPADAYFASGHQGQIVLVVPSRDVVAVRMGMTNGAPWPRDAFARAVLAALPPVDPRAQTSARAPQRAPSHAL